MKKQEKQRKPPQKSFFLIGLFGLFLVFMALSLGLFFREFEWEEYFFGAKLVESGLTPDASALKSRKLEFSSLPLIKRDQIDHQGETLGIPVDLRRVSFGVKREAVPVSGIVTTEDLAANKDFMLREIIARETISTVASFSGLVEESLTLHFDQSSIPVGEPAASFEYGLQGNLDILTIRFEDLYRYLEKAYLLSPEEMQNSGFQVQRFRVFQQGEQFTGDLVLVVSAREEPAILTP